MAGNGPSPEGTWAVYNKLMAGKDIAARPLYPKTSRSSLTEVTGATGPSGGSPG